MARNVLAKKLETCCKEPLTGFLRNGKCDTCSEDVGMHTVCAEMTAEFLAFSSSRGNDLSTPMPDFGFSGLKPGDRWCICLGRWLEAVEAGVAPPISLRATHVSVIEHVSMDVLTAHALPDEAAEDR